MSKDILPDHQLIAIARDDDYFFGVLHSRLHEVWSLRMGTSLEDRPRYTPTTTFETFPFPWPPGHEDTSSPVYQAIAEAARGQGLGTRLMQAIDARLYERGIRNQIVGAFEPNRSAVRFYLNIGFTPAVLQLAKFAR